MAIIAAMCQLLNPQGYLHVDFHVIMRQWGPGGRRTYLVGSIADLVRLPSKL